MIRVAINGFGRIGRMLTRVLSEKENIQIVAINDLGKIETLAHLFKYDSVHGKYPHAVEVKDKMLTINTNPICVFAEKNPENLPWKNLDVDIVIESTGRFRSRDLASLHLKAGAKKVIISAPPQDSSIKSVVLGVNQDTIDGTEEIISNASCTTNSAAPLVEVMKSLGTIEAAYITTVHSYTSDQRLHDAPHDDLRRARAAALSIVPTTTGAAKAITKIFPELEGKIGGCGIRVPVPDGSLTDMTFIMKEELDLTTINKAFKQAADGNLKGILEYTSDPVVSVDVVGNTHSCLFDSQLTSVMGKMVKILGWYDNEIGYSNRLADLIELWWNKQNK